MSFIPIAGAIVSFVFASLLIQQYRSKKVPFTLAWAVALILFGLGFIGETFGLTLGWNQVSAKMYYFFGGILAVGYLSMGTVYLLKPSAARWIVVVSLILIFVLWIPIFGIKLLASDSVMAIFIILLYLFTIFGSFVSTSRSLLFALGAVTILAAAGLLQHSVDLNILAKTRSWRDVMTVPLRSGAFALSSTGSFIIIIGAVYSAVTGWSDKKKRPHVMNTIIIAVGVLIAAIGGTLHGIFGIGKQLMLSLSTTIGITVMLLGYLRTRKKT